MGGDGGVGKSLLAKQLAASTALGLPWLGLPVETGSCLFVTAEDDRDEIHRRLDDIRTHLGADYEELERLHLVTLAGEDALLAVPESKSGTVQRTPLFDALWRAMTALAPCLVVLTRSPMFSVAKRMSGRTHGNSLACFVASQSDLIARCCCWRIPRFLGWLAAAERQVRRAGAIPFAQGSTWTE